METILREIMNKMNMVLQTVSSWCGTKNGVGGDNDDEKKKSLFLLHIIDVLTLVSPCQY